MSKKLVEPQLESTPVVLNGASCFIARSTPSDMIIDRPTIETIKTQFTNLYESMNQELVLNNNKFSIETLFVQYQEAAESFHQRLSYEAMRLKTLRKEIERKVITAYKNGAGMITQRQAILIGGATSPGEARAEANSKDKKHGDRRRSRNEDNTSSACQVRYLDVADDIPRVIEVAAEMPPAIAALLAVNINKEKLKIKEANKKKREEQLLEKMFDSDDKKYSEAKETTILINYEDPPSYEKDHDTDEL